MKIDYNTPVSNNYALNIFVKPYDVALQHFSRAFNVYEAYNEVVNGDTGIIYQIGSSIAHIATGAFELIPCVNIVILYVDRFFNDIAVPQSLYSDASIDRFVNCHDKIVNRQDINDSEALTVLLPENSASHPAIYVVLVDLTVGNK